MCVKKTIKKWYYLLMILFVLNLFLIKNITATNNQVINTTLDVNGIPYFQIEPVVDDSISFPIQQINLYAANKTIIWCNATVNDPNGIFDISKVSAIFFHEDVLSPLDQITNYNYYENTSCYYDEFGKTNCVFELSYYSKPGNWTCKLNASDAVGTFNTTTTSTTIKETLALRINQTQTQINFGMLSIGENTSDNDYAINITNIGNTNFDLQLNAWANSVEDDNDPAAMNCSVGYIPISALRYSINPNVSYDLKSSFQEIGYASAPFNLLSQTNSDLSHKQIYFGLGVNHNAGGICTGNLKIVAAK